MSDTHNPVVSVILEVYEFTQDEAYLRQIKKIVGEEEAFYARVRDIEALGLLGPLDEMEAELAERETEMMAVLHEQIGKSNAQLTQRSFQSPRQAKKRAEEFKTGSYELREKERDLYQSARAFERMAGVQLQTTRPAEAIDLDLIETVEHVLKQDAQSEIRNAKASVQLLKNILGRLESQRRQRFLQKHAHRIFWSLVIFTLLVGVLVSPIQDQFLSLVLIPIFLWVLQETLFKAWTEKLNLGLRYRQIKAWINLLILAQIRLETHWALERKRARGD